MAGNQNIVQMSEYFNQMKKKDSSNEKKIVQRAKK